jgi:hypothetical protein
MLTGPHWAARVPQNRALLHECAREMGVPQFAELFPLLFTSAPAPRLNPMLPLTPAFRQRSSVHMRVLSPLSS